MAQFPLIEISGLPTERGKQYGAAAKDRILKNIHFYKTLFETYGVEWSRAQKIAKNFEESNTCNFITF